VLCLSLNLSHTPRARHNRNRNQDAATLAFVTTALRRDAARMPLGAATLKADALPEKALWRIEATTFVAERPTKGRATA
jgi:hypothetical protein